MSLRNFRTSYDKHIRAGIKRELIRDFEWRIKPAIISTCDELIINNETHQVDLESLTKKDVKKFEDLVFDRFMSSQNFSNFSGYMGSILYILFYFILNTIDRIIIGMKLSVFIANIMFAISIPVGMWYGWKTYCRQYDYKAINNIIEDGMNVYKIKNIFESEIDTEKVDSELENLLDAEMDRVHNLQKMYKIWWDFRGLFRCLQQTDQVIMRDFTDLYFNSLYNSDQYHQVENV